LSLFLHARIQTVTKRPLNDRRETRKRWRTPRHPVYAWTVLEEARRARGMPRSFLLVRHVCHKGAVPGCIITVCARHTARFIREQRRDSCAGERNVAPFDRVAPRRFYSQNAPRESSSSLYDQTFPYLPTRVRAWRSFRSELSVVSAKYLGILVSFPKTLASSRLKKYVASLNASF